MRINGASTEQSDVESVIMVTGLLFPAHMQISFTNKEDLSGHFVPLVTFSSYHTLFILYSSLTVPLKEIRANDR